MTYKLTRDDLKTLGNGIRNANSMSVEEHLDAFLADKKTNDWQVIASGEVMCISINPETILVGDKSLKEIKNKLEDEITKHFDEDIEIAVRVKQNS